MKKTLIKLVALLLGITVMLNIPVSAMAAEPETSIPANATCHTIEITLEPGEELPDSDNTGIMPRIWDDKNYPNLGGGSVTYTPQMNIPDRYFAFECSAIGANGNTVPGLYSVALVRSGIAAIASQTNYVDGITYKLDWIDIDNTSASDYHFRIVNNTASTITVHITYYSWR